MSKDLRMRELKEVGTEDERVESWFGRATKGWRWQEKEERGLRV